MCEKSLVLVTVAAILALAGHVHATVVTTADGNGADTYVTNDETNDAESIMGAEPSLQVRNYAGVQVRIAYLRFDISAVQVDNDRYIGGDLSEATMTLNISGTQQANVTIYGLNDGANDYWNEATMSYINAPGILYVPATEIDGVPPGYYALDTGKITRLGSFPMAGGLATSDPAALNLDTFLNLDTNKLITFLIVLEKSDSAADWRVTTKESATPELAPAMTFPNAVEPLKIIWVSDTVNPNSTQDDRFWIDWLVAAGYDVNAQPDHWTELDAAKIAQLNDADLIVFSRMANSDAYASDANEVAAWASIATPILPMEDWELSDAGIQTFADAINTLTAVPKVCTSEVIPPAMPPVSALPSIPELPDPFKFMDGQRMTHLDEWRCRHAELSALVQYYEYGPYPPPPDNVTGVLNGETLTVTVQANGKEISYNATVRIPSSGDGPFPAFIFLGGGISADILNARGIAYISYNTNDIAVDSRPPRMGKLYDLYGADCGTGALMAWGWGVHRIIDALEDVPQIDETRIAVNGFSRWGKGALLAGAFDERIVLTVPSSSGQAGVGNYRSAIGVNNVQTLPQIKDEAPQWFGDGFGNNFATRVTSLPFDGHSVCALVAPRALIATEGGSDSWNNPPGPALSMQAAKIVYDYLGISDRIGYKCSINASHTMTEEQRDAILTFADKYLLGKDVSTDIFDEPFGPPSETLVPWSMPE